MAFKSLPNLTLANMGNVCHLPKAVLTCRSQLLIPEVIDLVPEPPNEAEETREGGPLAHLSSHSDGKRGEGRGILREVQLLTLRSFPGVFYLRHSTYLPLRPPRPHSAAQATPPAGTSYPKHILSLSSSPFTIFLFLSDRSGSARAGDGCCCPAPGGGRELELWASNPPTLSSAGNSGPAVFWSSRMPRPSPMRALLWPRPRGRQAAAAQR